MSEQNQPKPEPLCIEEPAPPVRRRFLVTEPERARLPGIFQIVEMPGRDMTEDDLVKLFRQQPYLWTRICARMAVSKG